MEAKKTVQGYFGAKQITRADFVLRWTSHFSETYWLANSAAEIKELEEMQRRIEQLAGAAWDRIPS